MVIGSRSRLPEHMAQSVTETQSNDLLSPPVPPRATVECDQCPVPGLLEVSSRGGAGQRGESGMSVRLFTIAACGPPTNADRAVLCKFTV